MIGSHIVDGLRRRCWQNQSNDGCMEASASMKIDSFISYWFDFILFYACGISSEKRPHTINRTLSHESRDSSKQPQSQIDRICESNSESQCILLNNLKVDIYAFLSTSSLQVIKLYVYGKWSFTLTSANGLSPWLLPRLEEKDWIQYNDIQLVILTSTSQCQVNLTPTRSKLPWPHLVYISRHSLSSLQLPASCDSCKNKTAMISDTESWGARLKNTRSRKA